METAQIKTNTREQNIKQAMDKLAQEAGFAVQDDAVTREGTKFIIPETMTIKDARHFLHQYEESQEAYNGFDRTFKALPNDGKAAMVRALKRITASSGIGMTIRGFFGDTPPLNETIDVNYGETMQIPTGRVGVPIFGKEAWIHPGTNIDADLGEVFHLTVYAPKKEETRVNVLFWVIEEELKTGSIYQGKAINAKPVPEFLDMSGVDLNKIVYSEGLERDIQSLVWSFVERREELKEKGIPFKRAITFYGDYGTGKSETMHGTAKKCIENGVTFIQCRAGKDNLEHAMRMARMLQPAVVAFEDVDVVADASSHQNTITRLLDLFDGMDAKHNDVMVLLTTNHISKLHKGMLRPGRIDALIKLGLLDADGIRRLSEIRLGEDSIGEVDWQAVYEAMHGYQPAFVNEALKRVELYRINGKKFDTKDFVTAAENLRPQFEQMSGAGEGSGPDRFEGLIEKVVRDAVHGNRITDKDGDEIGNYGMRIDAEKQDVAL